MFKYPLKVYLWGPCLSTESFGIIRMWVVHAMGVYHWVLPHFYWVLVNHASFFFLLSAFWIAEISQCILGEVDPQNAEKIQTSSSFSALYYWRKGEFCHPCLLPVSFLELSSYGHLLLPTALVKLFLPVRWPSLHYRAINWGVSVSIGESWENTVAESVDSQGCIGKDIIFLFYQ